MENINFLVLAVFFLVTLSLGVVAWVVAIKDLSAKVYAGFALLMTVVTPVLAWFLL